MMRSRRIVIWVLFISLFALEFGFGYYMSVIREFMPGDALSRVASAYNVLFSRFPHLGAIGFVWNPLPSMSELLLVVLSPIFPALAIYGLAGVIVTALFTAGTAVLVYRTGLHFKLSPLLSMLTCLLFMFNPMMLLYGANGMSEAMFVFFIVWSMVNLIKWLNEPKVNYLIKMSFALSFAFLTRYESVTFAMALFAAVVIAVVFIHRQQDSPQLGIVARLSKAEGTGVVLLSPFVYACLVWIGLNYMIMGNPLYFLNSSYSNVGQSEALLDNQIFSQMIGHPLEVVSFILHKSLWFAILFLFITLIRIYERRILRWDYLILVVLLISIPAMQYYLLLKGNSYGWLRFFMYPLPLAAAWLPYEFSRMKFRRVGIAVCLLGMLVSIGSVGYVMNDPVLASEEHEALHQGSQYKSQQQKREISAVVRNELEGANVLMDSFLAYDVVLRDSNPKRLFITSDYDFKNALKDPVKYKVDYILVPKPEGIAKLDAVNKQYPYLYEAGAYWCTLYKTFKDDWKIYKVTHQP